jgi:hypothetical protein
MMFRWQNRGLIKNVYFHFKRLLNSQPVPRIYSFHLSVNLVTPSHHVIYYHRRTLQPILPSQR